MLPLNFVYALQAFRLSGDTPPCVEQPFRSSYFHVVKNPVRGDTPPCDILTIIEKKFQKTLEKRV